MLRILVFALCLVPGAAAAQMNHDFMNGGPNQQMMHQHMMHRQMPNRPGAASAGPTAGTPKQPGQGAFAAIQEIVEILEADPKTDWSKVNIEALRQHLIDMSNVTLYAQATPEPIDGGMRFVVTGKGAVRDSIRRMVFAHARTMNNVGGWKFTAGNTDQGATLDVRVPPSDLPKLKALGFIGVMTHGMHHQPHHLMIARGGNPHH